MRDYYRRSYSRMPGYFYPEHFMEVPYWIPIVSSMLPPEMFMRELFVVTDMQMARQRMEQSDRGTVFVFSVLDANLDFVLDLAETGAWILAGGYVDPRLFERFRNVTWLDRPEDILSLLPGSRPGVALDYQLFDGVECIARYSLSTGCSFKCAFCTVPSKLTLADPAQVRAETNALRPLRFDLIFMDDKSFGDASNWRSIGTVRSAVQEFNPNFGGFIVQTPPSLAAKGGFREMTTPRPSLGSSGTPTSFP